MPAGKSAKASAETAPPAEIQALLNLLLADPKAQARLAVRVEPEPETPGIRAPTCAMPTGGDPRFSSIWLQWCRALRLGICLSSRATPQNPPDYRRSERLHASYRLSAADDCSASYRKNQD